MITLENKSSKLKRPLHNVLSKNNIKNKAIVISNYFLVFTVFGYSIYFHFLDNKIIFLIYTLLLGFIYILKYKITVSRIIAISAFYILIIALVQTLIFGAGKISTIFYNIITLLFFPYFIFKITGFSFIKIISNIITFFALLSLIFWLFTNYIPGFHELTYIFAQKISAPSWAAENEQFFIYTYEKAQAMGFIRNPGPSFEPGNWAVYLVLALIINLTLNKKLFTFSNTIIILSLITTFSSAGYIGLFILLCYYFVLSKVNLLIKLLIGPVAFLAFINLYSTLDFMETKIETRFVNESSSNLTEGSGRILGARRSWNVIKNYPLTGRGFLSATQADPLKEIEQYADYGFPSLAAKIGIIGFAFYFYFLLSSFYRINQLLNEQSKYFIVFALLALMVQLFSQASYSIPIFVMFFLSSPTLDLLQKRETTVSLKKIIISN